VKQKELQRQDLADKILKKFWMTMSERSEAKGEEYAKIFCKRRTNKRK